MSEIKDDSIVKQYKLGNATIKICDDYYKDKTTNELELFDKIIAKTAWECLLYAEKNENEKQTEKG